ncbi:MAG TPA: TonB-dependent receptor plug domain-containing protein, partial [Gemmatimonadales bacterium]|nr:TonB-dependent receptor plug domain-containing protein [Gemmatimonadales bacterium]
MLARALLFGIAATVVLAACHPHPIDVASPAGAGRIVITQTMIERSGGQTAWDVLKKEAPGFTFRENSRGEPTRLERRGQSSILLSDAPMIFLDGARLTDFHTLTQVLASTLQRIEILDGIEATTYYGTDAVGGAILMFSKNG